MPDAVLVRATESTKQYPSVTRVSSWEELQGLSAQWDRLAKTADQFFLTWEFIASWWQAYGKNRELFVLCCRDEQERTVAIAPLYRDKEKRLVGLQIKTLRLI